jgi:hypothetical protein
MSAIKELLKKRVGKEETTNIWLGEVVKVKVVKADDETVALEVVAVNPGSSLTVGSTIFMHYPAIIIIA